MKALWALPILPIRIFFKSRIPSSLPLPFHSWDQKTHPPKLFPHTNQMQSDYRGRRPRYRLKWWSRCGSESGWGGGVMWGEGRSRRRSFFISLLADESGVKHLLWREPLITPIYSKLPKNVGLLWGCNNKKKKGLWMLIL